MKPFTTSRRLAAACALACLLAAGTTAHAAAPAADVPAEAAAPPADPPPAPNTPELSPTQFQGVILEIGVQKGAKAANFDQLTLQPDGPYQPVTLPVARPEDKLALQAGARKGDRIWVNVDDPVNPTRIVGISRIARPVATPVLIGAVAGVVVLLGLFVSLATRGRPQRFLVGHDGRLSNSQCQLALWFGVVAVAYGATLVLRYQVLGPDFIGGIGLTTNVLALTGLSALTFGGAKIVSTQKQDAASDAAAETATTAASVAETAANIASTTAAVAGVPTDNPVIASTASAAA
ncbi:hypothetical protein PMI01_03253, partial [Caulobacter sp. AP07]|uniref:hypothetical protein n=1 Tax=Caulobacter sp. AP07 TaxID=1144304 RepID=UPI0002720C47